MNSSQSRYPLLLRPKAANGFLTRCVGGYSTYCTTKLGAAKLQYRYGAKAGDCPRGVNSR